MKLHTKVLVALAGLTLVGGTVLSLLNVNVQEAIPTKAYSESNEWYVTGEFNSWNKIDPKCHLTYDSPSGNNHIFQSDYAITIREGQKFNFVTDSGDTTICPDLVSGTGEFTHPADTDYLVANEDITVTFTFEKYKDGYWAGLSWYNVGEGTYAKDYNKCLESWCYDFVASTDIICDGTDRDNLASLNNVWKDSSSGIEQTYILAGSFGTSAWNEKNTSYQMKQVGDSDVYRISNIWFNSGEAFKVTIGSWDSSWPEGAGNNWIVNYAGHYTIDFDSSTNGITVTMMQFFDVTFNELSATAKSYFNSSNETPKIASAYARYTHIVNRYGDINDFAGLRVGSGANKIVVAEENQNFILPVALIVGATLALSAGIFLVRKRKTL